CYFVSFFVRFFTPHPKNHAMLRPTHNSSIPLLLFLVLSLFSAISFALYLPGVAPAEYLPGEEIELNVNQLTSIDTQLPYRYYDLPFCRPKNIQDARENLGEILLGDLIENSPYI